MNAPDKGEATPDSLSSGALGVPPGALSRSIENAVLTLRQADAEIVRLRASLAAVSEERDKILRFVGRAMKESRAPWPADWDGGSVEDALCEAGILERFDVVERCGEWCECRIGDTCCRATDLGKRALASVSALPVVEEPSE